MNKVFIVAEAGVNHNGKLKTAKKMVDAAVLAGVDAIKFQTFKAEKEISIFVPKAPYQKADKNDNESQLEMVKKLELSFNDHKKIIAYCKHKKIIFFSSAFDLDSIDMLDRLGVGLFKIPSSEMTNLPYLRKIGNLRKKLILSSGMATLKEVGKAIGILAANGTPKRNITVLHCSSEYPVPAKHVNLRAMVTIKNAFNVRVGYSDHTLGIEVAIAAAALGAVIIEKHFTLDRNMPGPDHKISLEPEELKMLVKSIRNVEAALGDGIKRPTLLEKRNSLMIRKSIVASLNIEKGEAFSGKNITAKRAGRGISPMYWDKIIGKKAKRNFTKDETIKL